MTAISLGTYKFGEVPLDLLYTFEESDGTPIDLSGFTVKANTTSPAQVSADYNGSLSTAVAGIVAVPWAAAMTGEVGPWSMHIWASNGSTKLVSATLLYNVTYADSPTFA